MARVHTAKANKDYPEKGIKKGDTYYWWQLYKCPKQMSLNRPRPSQLTNSKMSAAYAAQEELEDTLDKATEPQDIVDALRAAAESVEDVATEYRDAKDNMPEGLQEGPTGQECEEKADALEQYASDLNEAADEIENIDINDHIDDNARPPSAEKPSKFDDLSEGEQTDYMDAVREIAGNPSLDV